MFQDMITSFTQNGVLLNTFKILFYTAPIWLPVLLGAMFVQIWMRYIRTLFISKQGSVLLEIRLPKEMLKSPLAVEIFLTSLFQTANSTYIEAYWAGKVRPWFSLELVSIEGKAKFYIWAHKKFKGLIETQLYAQFPNIEVFESPDYTTWAYHDPVNLPMWGAQFVLTGPDALPIKTYVDYGLDKPAEEEEKIDPMTATLEFLGSLKKGEHVWIQIMIQAHKKLKLADGVLFARPDWKADARKVIKEVMKSATVKPEGQEEGNGYINLSPGETDKVKAIERSLAKFPFETMIRGIYLSEKESFNPNNIPALIGTFRQYNSNELNGFRLGWITDFDYPWQDFRRMRRNTAERQMLDAYKKRSFFQYPYKNLHIKKPFILTTEEIATIFHFPGGVAKTPTVDRILSKKAEPPANLPM